ncbi:Fic family protein [bacterium]|nr:Fic family protein [bacterium]
MSNFLSKTHPWINFALDLRNAPPTFWLQLGEAKSLCQRMGQVPLEESLRHELMKIYLAKGVRASAAIEGNTLSEEQVRDQIEGDLDLPPSQGYLGREIQNVLSGCNAVLRDAKSGASLEVTEKGIRDFNGGLLDGLEVEEGVAPGKIGQGTRHVGRYKCPSSEDCRRLLSRLVEWLNGSGWDPQEGVDGLSWGILRSLTAHLYLVWIHPFGDGNGRTARLLEFQILLAAGVPAPSAHLLSNHYNNTRSVYYRKLEVSSQVDGGDVAFLAYALEGFVEGLRKQWEWVEARQLAMTWEAMVHRQFSVATGPVAKRRRDLLLAMTSQAPMTPTQLMGITPEIARQYGKRTIKTMTRDLNHLLANGFLVREGRAYRAAVELALSHRPSHWLSQSP